MDRSPVLHRNGVLFVGACDDFLNCILFNFTYFVENLEILVVDSIKLIRCNVCGIVRYL